MAVTFPFGEEEEVTSLCLSISIDLSSCHFFMTVLVIGLIGIRGHQSGKSYE